MGDECRGKSTKQQGTGTRKEWGATGGMNSIGEGEVTMQEEIGSNRGGETQLLPQQNIVQIDSQTPTRQETAR